MLVVVSPAKKLDMSPEVEKIKTSKPLFSDDTDRLVKAASQLSEENLQSLMKISPALARLNRERFNNFGNQERKPAAFAFAGDTYNGFDAKSLDEDALRWAKNQDNLGEPLLNNSAARESIADWYCEKSGLKNTKLRTMSALSRGETPGPEASITKIVSAGKLQDIGNFGIDSLDMAGMLKTENDDIRGFQNAWLGAPGLRIAGGTDEILRNIIAERVLGLPQDPRADKGVAFKDIPSGNS